MAGRFELFRFGQRLDLGEEAERRNLVQNDFERATFERKPSGSAALRDGRARFEPEPFEEANPVGADLFDGCFVGVGGKRGAERKLDFFADFRFRVEARALERRGEAAVLAADAQRFPLGREPGGFVAEKEVDFGARRVENEREIVPKAGLVSGGVRNAELHFDFKHFNRGKAGKMEGMGKRRRGAARLGNAAALGSGSD